MDSLESGGSLSVSYVKDESLRVAIAVTVDRTSIPPDSSLI